MLEDKTRARPRLKYWQEGAHGPQVLFVMGFGMRGAIWASQTNALREDHQVAYFDQRGVGESEESPTRLWSMREMAEDALRVAEALRWDHFHLVGVSMGGMIAQELAIRAPARVSSLTLIATQAGGPGAWIPTPAGARAFLRSQREATRIEGLKTLLYSPEFVKTRGDDPALAARMKAQIGSPTPLSTILGQFGAILRHDTRARLAQLQLPTLIIKPQRDILVRNSHSDHLHKHIAGSVLKEVPGGHGAVFENAEEINALLREHIAHAEERSLSSAAQQNSVTPPT